MSAAPSSTRSVVAALLGNAFVAAIKLVAFLLSGSGAMLSEAVHSAADTSNQALLYLGLRRSTRARDADYQYGYGGERFVFGLLSAAGVFFVGAGVTIYHGVHSLIAPEMPDISALTFAVLALSFLIEGGVLVYALVQALRKCGDAPFLEYLRERADPAEVAILLEDSAAVLGLVLAAVGIAATHATGRPLFDSVASIIVGALLGLVAIYLVLENRALLLGVAVPKEVEDRFLAVVQGWPGVEAVHDLKTRQLTPESFIFKAEIKLRESDLARKLDSVLPELDFAGARREEGLRLVSRAAIDAIGSEIDAIESAIRAAIPEARHIDLEIEHLPRAKVPRTTDLPPPE